ncbi:hypothetical protein J2X36_003226 [Methylobacterium sp. BE186]|uniref:hypothetical protein n=1 Tax=Methylobacterium sp. BE186 TaxID=2817715 RepID=UPI00285FCBF3|nr:hypothetical protein [Methylobacterium sp. BE186]MDR7038462.1 hypothetical protein [Methylobacterium sp. BE186]
MPKPQKHKAHLVVVLRKGQPRCVCAAVKRTPEEALAATKAAYAEAKVYLVGGLARNMVRKLRLSHDEVRPF